MTRIAWILVGLCAATLTMAQVARPPDAPPAPISPPVKRHDFEAMKAQPPRSPDGLPPVALAAYKSAVKDEACPDATDALIDVYIADYPRQAALGSASPLQLSIWWRKAGLKAYAAAYDCFVIDRFVRAANAYEAADRRGYRWCGQYDFDLEIALKPGDDDILGELLNAIDILISLSDDDDDPRDIDPFSPRAVRRILASDSEYDFVDLAPIFWFNALDILRVSGVITAGESDELQRLEKSLPQDQIGMVQGLGYYYDKDKRYSGGLYPSLRYAEDYCLGSRPVPGK